MTTYTIKNNTYFKSLEISFSEKPSEQIRNILKEYRFRWNHTLKIWYGFANKEDITSRLNSALKIQKPIIKAVKKFENNLIDTIKKVEKKEAVTTKKASCKKANNNKIISVNKLKKAVTSEKDSCILVCDKSDNSIIAKLPLNSSVEKYDRFKYCFYYIY